MKTQTLPFWFIRVSLIAVAIAGLAAIGLNFTLVKQKITGLESRLAAQTLALQHAETDLARTRTDLTSTTVTLKTTRTALETTTAEKREALAGLAEETKRNKDLNADLAQSNRDRNAAQAELARYHAAGMKPEQIIMAAQRIRELGAALAAAQQTNSELVAQLKRLLFRPVGPILLPAKLRAKVLATDPKWHFIVLDAGEKQGMLANAEVLVSRQGQFVARARVSRVEDDRCIANLMPGSESAQVLEGDVVIPAFPRS